MNSKRVSCFLYILDGTDNRATMNGSMVQLHFIINECEVMAYL